MLQHSCIQMTFKHTSVHAQPVTLHHQQRLSIFGAHSALQMLLSLSIVTIRPHRSTMYVDAAYCYQQSSVVCRVCLSVTLVSLANTTELIEMPFRLRIRMGQRNHVLDGVNTATWEAEILRGKA